MSRGKPLILSRTPGSETRARKKRESEDAFRAGCLPANPPAELKGMPAARRAWRQLMKAHELLPGELFNGLDRVFLVDYCMAVQSRHNAVDLESKVKKLFEEGEAELEDLIRARAELRMATRLVVDFSKQAYLTPKSRGGVTPDDRELTPEEIVERELEELDFLTEGRE